MSDQHVPGRRERKKAATRQTIVDAAIEMFLADGFDAVSVRDIADRADVSPTTVFAHFPQKEALLFFEEGEQRERLLSAVRGRTSAQTISAALKEHYRAELVAMRSGEDGALRGRVRLLMEQTPALQDYAGRMWQRHELALAQAVGDELGLRQPTDEIRAYVRFALQIQLLISSDTDPMLDTAFDLLDRGWIRECQQADG